MFLFALPFAGAGLIALFQGTRQIPAGKTKDIAGLMMIGGYYALRTERAKNARMTAQPNGPWRWRMPDRPTPVNC